MQLTEVISRRPWSSVLVEPIRDPHLLSPLNRMLLVTDGTVTDAVEAYTLERCAVMKLEQRMHRLDRSLAVLELRSGAAVLERTIAMRGAESGKVRFLAHTVFALSRMGKRFLSDLDQTDLPLGDVLRRHAPSARREILGAGLVRRRPRGPLRRWMDEAPVWLVRSYRLHVRGAAIALVNEYLPETENSLYSARGGG